MLQRIVGSTFAIVLLLAAGFSNDPPFAPVCAEEGEACKAPVDNWRNWWPKSQFGADDGVDEAAVRKCSRVWSNVRYSSFSNPWGLSFPVLSRDSDSSRLRVGMSMIVSDSVEKPFEKTPKQGDVKIAIVLAGKVVRESKNGDPVIDGFFGSMGSLQGSMSASFDWLPADFEDYWIRIDCKEERHWLLIPYGLGSDPRHNGEIKQTKRRSPTRPLGVAEKDTVQSWGSVQFELSDTGPGNRHITASISNPFDTTVSLNLYREGGRWNLASPRTSVTYIWPHGYTRFASLMRLSRDLMHERDDEFEFWRTPQDIATWGMLRVTLEEEKFDIAVPSSLFHYTHGYVPEK